MITRRTIVPVVIVAAAVGALAVLAGCTVRSAGDPGSKTSTSRPTTSTAENPLPPRSRELDLAGVDPCADLLTQQQLEELDYDLGYVRPPKPANSRIHGGPECFFASTGISGESGRNMSTLVGISTTEGAETWAIDPARAPAKPPEVVRIEGFSALVLPHPKIVDDCLVVVDTADGQYLEVSNGPSRAPRNSPEPSCAEAERVAGMALQTIAAAG